MFGLQATDILGIAIVALILFGPSRLPNVARGIGQGMREFQAALKGEPERPKEPAKAESAPPQEPVKTIPSGTTDATAPVQFPPSEL